MTRQDDRQFRVPGSSAPSDDAREDAIAAALQRFDAASAQLSQGEPSQDPGASAVVLESCRKSWIRRVAEIQFDCLDDQGGGIARGGAIRIRNDHIVKSRLAELNVPQR